MFDNTAACRRGPPGSRTRGRASCSSTQDGGRYSLAHTANTNNTATFKPYSVIQSKSLGDRSSIIVMRIVPSTCAHAMHVITLHYPHAYGLMPLKPHSEQAWQIMGNCTVPNVATISTISSQIDVTNVTNLFYNEGFIHCLAGDLLDLSMNAEMGMMQRRRGQPGAEPSSFCCFASIKQAQPWPSPTWATQPRPSYSGGRSGGPSSAKH